MPIPGLSTFENAWRAIIWTALQKNFPFTPLVRVPTQGRPAGLLLLAGCTFMALVAMTFQIHMAGLHVLPVARPEDPTAADSLAEFSASTLEAVMDGMQLSRLTPWAGTLLLATAAALTLQCGLMVLVILVGRLRGARAMSFDGLSYWVIQPVAWTAISTISVGLVLFGLRWMLGAGQHPFMADVAFVLSVGGCAAGMAAPVVILARRMNRHGRRMASSWDWVAVVLLVTGPTSVLTNSAWTLATERALARVPSVLVRGLQTCDEPGRTCTLALVSSNAGELELHDGVTVRFRVADAKGQWLPQAFDLRAKLLNESEARGTPVVLLEGRRRYVRLQFDAKQVCAPVLMHALLGRDIVAMQTTFLLSGVEFSPSGEVRNARIKSDNPNYLPYVWRPTIGRACLGP